MLEVPIDLSSLLQTTTIECVQEVDATKLTTLLQWIVECLQKQNEDSQRNAHSIQTLSEEHQNESRVLQTQLSEVQKSQGSLASLFEETIRAEENKRGKLTSIGDDIASIGLRVTNLEGRSPKDEASDADTLCKRMQEIDRRLQSLEEKTDDFKNEKPAHMSVDPITRSPPEVTCNKEGQSKTVEGEMEDTDTDKGMAAIQIALADFDGRMDKMQIAIAALKEGFDDLRSCSPDRAATSREDSFCASAMPFSAGSSAETPHHPTPSSTAPLSGPEVSKGNVPDAAEKTAACATQVSDTENDASSEEVVQRRETHPALLSPTTGDSNEKDHKEPEPVDRAELLQIEKKLDAMEAEFIVFKRRELERARQAADDITSSATCQRSKLTETAISEDAGEKVSSLSMSRPGGLFHTHSSAADKLAPTTESLKEVPVSSLTPPKHTASSLLQNIEHSELLKIKEKLESLEERKADKEDLGTVRAAVNMLDRQVKNLAQEYSKSTSEAAAPIITSLEEPEMANDRNRIREMRSQLQGLQKTLHDLLRRLDSPDPQAIQNVQKRLRKLETAFKKICDQRKRLAEEPMQDGRSRGEHAMLSGKPAFGYRCMACDQPLTKLQIVKGPHLPSNVLPMSRPKTRSEPTERPEAEAPIAVESTTPRNDEADLGPRLGQGGWKPHGNYHRKLKNRSGGRHKTS